MHLPRTYRLRLVAYITVLLVFLVAVLAFSYYASRALILQEAGNNIARMAQQIEGQLGYDARDSRARARMIRDNVPLTEYLFIAVSVGTDAAAIRELYQRQFGWLPANRVVLLARNGKAMIGPEHADLIQALRAPQKPLERQFYIYGKNGLELVSVAPVDYRSQHLGVVAITAVIGDEWMRATRQISNGHLIMAKDGKIVLTTLGGEQAGLAFNPESNALRAGNEEYLVRQIQLAGADPSLPTLWFALPKAELTERINRQRDRMLALATATGVGILLIGLLMLRNFSAPISHLMGMIKEVGAGRLPDLPRTHARDEIGFLWNQFASMVGSLREKQEQLTGIHQQLERQAITDELTGLYNRRYLYDIYPKLCAEALRQHSSLALILIDLDNFKLVNDRFGHLAGDSVLVNFAALLHEACRVSDFLIRVGGEEFLVLTRGDTEGAAVLAEKIRAALEQCAITVGENTIRVTASFGVACAEESDDRNALEQVLVRADRALYAAKQAGRNRVMSWAPTLMAVSSR